MYTLAIRTYNCWYVSKKILSEKNLYIIDRGSRDDKKPLKLNTFQRSLIVGTDVEPENRTEEIDF